MWLFSYIYTINDFLEKIMVHNICNEDRCEILAKYIIDNKATVRDAAKQFGISKSTVHKDVTEKLKKRNYSLFKEVEKILQINKSERHLRGGEATKKKYLKIF